MKSNWSLKPAAPFDFADYLKTIESEERQRPLLLSQNKLISQLLYNRGLTEEATIQAFLSPDYDQHVHDPLLFKNMPKAVERVRKALATGERIHVFTDYDADGICGATVLSEFFRQVNANFSVSMPHRLTETYGLTMEKIEDFFKQGITLLITVDCGVTDYKEIEYAEEHGMNVIVVDHHLVPPKWPPAFAIVDHKQEDETYPEHVLSGAGLAFKLVAALVATGDFSVTRDQIKWLLDVVAIAAVADMVPLKGENRVFVTYGLRVMRKLRRQGLAALLHVSGISASQITEETIGFTIAPRINAASRMDHPRMALDLLLADHPLEARRQAEHLDKKNSERKFETEKIFTDLETRFRGRELPPVIFEGSESWSAGVVGLAANRFMEKYQRPVFLYALKETIAKGSCRAPMGLNIVELMREATHHFDDFGGHESAGGFSFTPDKRPSLENFFGTITNLTFEPQLLYIEGELTLADCSKDVFSALRLLAPFGQDNPSPKFLLKHVPVAEVKKLGSSGEHIKLFLGDEKIPAIFFRAGLYTKTLTKGQKVDAVVELVENTWKGRTTIELRVLDLDPA